MKHFVTPDYEGRLCPINDCHKPVSHKVVEAVPLDEPCLVCGDAWRGKDNAPASFKQCMHLFHYNNTPVREGHDRYLCCTHFMQVMGEVECPET